jgi:hypothetical protein
MTKRKIFLIIPILIICISAFVAFLIYFFFPFSLGSADEGTYRTNQEIIEYFNKNKDIFISLNEELLVYAKKGLYRIDDNWTGPANISEIGIDNDKLKRLRRLFNSINMPRGIGCDNKSIKYYLHTSGLSVSGGSEGFLFSIDEPSNYFKDESQGIQTKPFEIVNDVKYPEKGSYCIYIRIQKNWYIYNEYED